MTTRADRSRSTSGRATSWGWNGRGTERLGLTEAGTRQHALALNIARRHLTAEKRSIKQRIVDAPERSDRSLAKDVGVHHETVGAARSNLEERGEIRHTETRTDSTGRRPPASKPKASRGSSGQSGRRPLIPNPRCPPRHDETSAPEDDEREVAGELDARLLDDLGRRLLAAAQRYAEVIDEALARPEGEDPVTALSEADFTGLKAACSRIALFHAISVSSPAPVGRPRRRPR